MRIAVISDTHNQLPNPVLQSISDADEIWHLGDVTDPRILAEIAALGRPFHVVRGNCDSNMEWPLELDFTLSNLKIRLVHIPPSYAPPGVDLLLHGHTHVPRQERVGSTYFLNPGCIGRPNRGAPSSYAWLIVEDGKPFSWKIIPLL